MACELMGYSHVFRLAKSSILKVSYFFETIAKHIKIVLNDADEN